MHINYNVILLGMSIALKRVSSTISYDQASSICKNEGKELCKSKEICRGNNKPYLGPIPGDHWVPVIDSSNEWLQIGKRKLFELMHSKTRYNKYFQSLYNTFSATYIVTHSSWYTRVLQGCYTLVESVTCLHYVRFQCLLNKNFEMLIKPHITLTLIQGVKINIMFPVSRLVVVWRLKCHIFFSFFSQFC
jgi:hypothetical protein